MLASTVIECLVDNYRSPDGVGVVYVFCDYKTEDEQTPLSLLANLLKQLCLHRSSIPNEIRRLYEQHNGGVEITRPSLGSIFESLKLIAASFPKIYIVVDALNELQQHDNMTPTFLSKLSALQATTSVNLMLTSQDIPRVLEGIQNAVKLEVRASDEDVLRYVDGYINKLPDFVSRSPTIQKCIKDAILHAADGMYVSFTIFSYKQVC